MPAPGGASTGLFGAEAALETDYFEGRHQVSGRRAYDFLWEKLGGGNSLK